MSRFLTGTRLAPASDPATVRSRQRTAAVGPARKVQYGQAQPAYDQPKSAGE